MRRSAGAVVVLVLTSGCFSEARVAQTYDAAGYVGAFMGQHQGALQGFQEVVHMRPSLAEGRYDAGVALANLGRWDEALAAFRKAAALKPTLARAHLGAGLSLAKLGRPDEAAAEYRLAGRADGSGPVALSDVPYCTHYHLLPDGC